MDKFKKICITFILSVLFSGVILSQEKEKKDFIEVSTGEKIYYKEKKIELEGVILLESGLIEVGLCGENAAKDHEAVVQVKCVPHNIHFAILLFGLKEGKGSKFEGAPDTPSGDRVIIEVSWDDEGKKKTVWLEDLIYDVVRNASMPRVGWVFTGSKLIQEIDPDTKKPMGKDLYLADREKTIAATYRNPSAIFENPLPEGNDDERYYANKNVLPKKGTKVTVTIRLFTEDEKKTILKNSDESKEDKSKEKK